MPIKYSMLLPSTHSPHYLSLPYLLELRTSMKIRAKLIASLLILVATTVSSQNTSTCPFNVLFHFGDGLTDIGNSIHVLPKLSIPPGKAPYGMTYPGYPTGRWSDGLVDFDFTSIDFGLPNIVPYLNMNQSEAATYDGVIFSVGRSPVLDFEFFAKRNIVIPPYAVPLSHQFKWFKTHLKSVYKTKAAIAERLANALLLMGDIEGNDIGYALTQGKTIKEIRTYVPRIVNEIIDTTRKIINLGAMRAIIPGNGPLGCYPYILTALQTNDSTAYDEFGCLKSVNDFTRYKNLYLQVAIADLQSEFPDVQILFGPMYDGLLSLIGNASVIGPDGNSALKSCCGIGGMYNYNSKRFCGDKGVPVCSNPDDYIYWDGMHFTQQTQWEAEDMLVGPALVNLGCETLPSAALRYKRPRKISSEDATYVASY